MARNHVSECPYLISVALSQALSVDLMRTMIRNACGPVHGKLKDTIVACLNSASFMELIMSSRAYESAALSAILPLVVPWTTNAL